ncbi:hypothetical protein CL65_gp110 [Mycobacterium phage Patience]|uniref:Uncharacterized protein n=1 Tax=Mycobacterium phage Patience TaxID=1074308 RepID=G1JWJ8_9CAUD|nr:hypothetical protein CL65_gp110 [Mycobacterium phage Patience]AEL97996.1 hypothetical protein PATIENCE_88 [Mycobacterium phage Patience]
MVSVEDTVIQMRDYAVLAKDEEDAKNRIARGEFLTESEASTIDNVGPSRVTTIMKVEETNAGSRNGSVAEIQPNQA